MGALCITELEYEGHGQERRNFSQFLQQISDF
jgi:hypothetical protein